MKEIRINSNIIDKCELPILSNQRTYYDKEKLKNFLIDNNISIRKWAEAVGVPECTIRSGILSFSFMRKSTLLKYLKAITPDYEYLLNYIERTEEQHNQIIDERIENRKRNLHRLRYGL